MTREQLENVQAREALEPIPCRNWSEALVGKVSAETGIYPNEPLARRTTLRVGGPADLLLEPASEADLAVAIRFGAAQGVPVFVLRRGSNLLVRDGGVRGIVICLSHPGFSKVEIQGERLICGAGAKLKSVAVEARRRCLAGLEFLEGIPGSVGGALRMNAGAMGAWTFDVVESIRMMDLDGCITEKSARELVVEYRACKTLERRIALQAVLRAWRESREKIEERMNEFSQRRWKSQPAAPSAGCMFKNPAAIPAGKLIDELGLKGTRVGGAVISPEHGNFIVNSGGATAKDVLALIELIQRRARAERGVELETEVEIVGEPEH